MQGVRMRFQTVELGGLDYHLRGLRDVQQCADSAPEAEQFGISSATWPLFGVLWPAEEFLSHLMLGEELGARRVLEVGCGLGLASLVLKRRGADITATDHHPDVDQFLQFNADLNEIDRVAFHRVSWLDGATSLGRFDLVVGSDLLYDHHNLDPLVQFLDDHVEHDGQILMVDPSRGLTVKFTRLLQALGYGAEVTSEGYASVDGPSSDYRVMRFTRPA